MNNPAAKEPSMDEILSSIRQIIADEDQPGQQSAPPPEPASASGAPALEKAADAAMLAAAPAVPAASAPAAEPEPLALSEEQMIAQPAAGNDETADISFSPEVPPPPISDPVVKEEPTQAAPAPAGTDDEAQGAPPSGAIAEPAAPETAPQEPAPEQPGQEVELVVADDVAFDESEAGGEVSSSAMPDPDLSAEMAETLLAPTTDAATRHAFSKLNALSIGGSDLTLEAIVRDMLRPMLKDWLDENLPATVERMVEKEIERVSRGH